MKELSTKWMCCFLESLLWQLLSCQGWLVSAVVESWWLMEKANTQFLESINRQAK